MGPPVRLCLLGQRALQPAVRGQAVGRRALAHERQVLVEIEGDERGALQVDECALGGVGVDDDEALQVVVQQGERRAPPGPDGEDPSSLVAVLQLTLDARVLTNLRKIDLAQWHLDRECPGRTSSISARRQLKTTEVRMWPLWAPKPSHEGRGCVKAGSRSSPSRKMGPD